MEDNEHLLPQDEHEKNILPSPTASLQNGIVNAALLDEGNTSTNGPNVVIEQPSKEQIFEAIHTERKRWYILAVFSQLACTQGMIWNTWGPIASSAKYALDWDNGTIAMLSNWGAISFIISALPFAWIMDVTGMRLSAIISAVLVLGCTALRCITVHSPGVTIVNHIGHFLNGLPGPVVMAGCPVISNAWFPIDQRTTATALCSIWGTLGTALPFIICPYMVRDVNAMSNCTNHSSPVYNSSQCGEFKHGVQHDIQILMFTQAGMALAISLFIFVYFPNRPNHAPSITANSPRLDFFPGLKQLICNWRFWMLAAPYGLSTGVLSGWGSVLDVILSPIGIDEATAGWIGFVGTVSAMVSGLLIGLFSDIFTKRMRLTLIVCFSVSTVAFLVFSLQCQKLIPGDHRTVILFVTNVLGNLGLLGTVPLFYELGCETAFPVAEGSTTTLLTLINNAVVLVFLVVLMFPEVGTLWMNWCLTGSLVVCIPVFLVFKERYSRLDIDTQRLNTENN